LGKHLVHIHPEGTRSGKSVQEIHRLAQTDHRIDLQILGHRGFLGILRGKQYAFETGIFDGHGNG